MLSLSSSGCGRVANEHRVTQRRIEETILIIKRVQQGRTTYLVNHKTNALWSSTVRDALSFKTRKRAWDIVGKLLPIDREQFADPDIKYFVELKTRYYVPRTKSEHDYEDDDDL